MSIRDTLAVAWDDGSPDQAPHPYCAPRHAAPATWVPDAPTPDPRRTTGHCPTCGHAIDGDHYCPEEDS